MCCKLSRYYCVISSMPDGFNDKMGLICRVKNAGKIIVKVENGTNLA